MFSYESYHSSDVDTSRGLVDGKETNKPSAQHLLGLNNAFPIYHDLFLFSPLLTPDNIPEIQRVKVHSNISVPCPSFTAVEMKFILYKGQNNIASIIYGNISHVMNSEHLGNKMSHYVHTDSNNTCFVLHNVTMDATGLYTCTAKRSYPPPMVEIQEEPQTIVIVERV